MVSARCMSCLPIGVPLVLEGPITRCFVCVFVCLFVYFCFGLYSLRVPHGSLVFWPLCSRCLVFGALFWFASLVGWGPRFRGVGVGGGSGCVLREGV